MEEDDGESHGVGLTPGLWRRRAGAPHARLGFKCRQGGSVTRKNS